MADLDCLELGQNLQHDDMQMVLAFAMGCAKVFCFTKLNCQVQTTLLKPLLFHKKSLNCTTTETVVMLPTGNCSRSRFESCLDTPRQRLVYDYKAIIAKLGTLHLSLSLKNLVAVLASVGSTGMHDR